MVISNLLLSEYVGAKSASRISGIISIWKIESCDAKDSLEILGSQGVTCSTILCSGSHIFLIVYHVSILK